LFAEWNRCYILGDAHGLVALLDDEAVNEFAATLLTFASHYATVNPERVAKDVRQKIASLLHTQRRAQPTAEARAAEALVFQQLYPRGVQDGAPNKMRQDMAVASGVLVNPRSFCADYLAIVLPVVRGGSLDDGLPAWQIDVVGDNATGTTESDFCGTSSTFEAIHHQAGWLIHSVYGSATPSSAELVLTADTDHLVESPPLHYFESPEALMAEWNHCYLAHDASGIVSLMDDAAVSELAGLLLVNATVYANADSEVIYVQIADALKMLLRKYRQENPSLQANIAEAVIYDKKVSTDPRGPVTEEIRKHMVAAAESLSNPRQFCVEALSAFMPLTHDPMIELPSWRTTAVVEDSKRVRATTTYSFPMMSNVFHVERNDSGWLIHTVFAAPPLDEGGQNDSQALLYSESPEALMDKWVRRSAGNNVADLVPIMDDNAASEFAAVMLFATASMSSVAQMAQMTGAAGVDTDMGQMLMIPAILERHKHDDPPPAAQLAYSQLSAVAVQVMFQGQLSDAKTPLPPRLLLQQLQAAVGILKNPRAFILELGPVFSAMSDTDQKAKSDLHWRIVNRSEDSVTVLVGDKNKPQQDAEMQLKKEDTGWLVHAYLSEQTVSQLMPQNSSAGPPQAVPAADITNESAPITPPITANDHGAIGRSSTPAPRTLRYFETPEELMVEWNRCAAENDHEAMTSLIDDNAARELAGMYLFSVASASTMTQLVQASGTAQLDPGVEAMMSIVKIIERHRRTDPPPTATLAYTQMSSQSILMLVQSQNPMPPPKISPKKLYSQMLTAADILVDPRAFIAEIAAAFEALEGESKSDVQETPQWKIDIDGTAAIATSQSGSSTSGYRLAQHEKGWIIHSVLSEELLAGMFQPKPGTVPAATIATPPNSQ